MEWKLLVYFMGIWNISPSFGIYFMAIWYSLWPFGLFSPVLVCLTKKKSGNPAWATLWAFFSQTHLATLL
jgi:hypothetical protein